MNTLGERIATYRKKVNLTQEQLAEKCTVTAQAVSKWENDLTAPDITLIPRLAEIFNVTCDELLGVRRAQTVAVDPSTIDISKMLLKIKVNSADGEVVNVNMPLSVAEVEFKDAVSWGKQEGEMKIIEMKQLISLVKNGAVGKLMEVEADGDRVEIWVE